MNRRRDFVRQLSMYLRTHTSFDVFKATYGEDRTSYYRSAKLERIQRDPLGWMESLDDEHLDRFLEAVEADESSWIEQ